ncbi:hypothetical protein RCL1_006327 [Eukaryota sp. TZLM3-RCL]
MHVTVDREVQGHLLTISLLQLVLSLTFMAPSAYSFVIALPMLAFALVGFVGAIKEKRTLIGLYSFCCITNTLIFLFILTSSGILARRFELPENPYESRHIVQTMGMRLSLTLFFLLFSILASTVSTVYYRHLCDQNHVQKEPEATVQIVYQFLSNLLCNSCRQAPTFTPAPPSPHSSPPEGEPSERCRFCNHRKASVVSLGCGHLSLCDSCSRKTRTCPVCGRRLRNTVHVFQT